MALTSPENIQKRIKENIDRNQRDSWYRQMNYAFGKPWAAEIGASALSAADEFPDYPDVVADALKVGETRRILGAQYISLSKIMYSEPSPKFPQVDKYTAEVRKQFFDTRSRDGEWTDERNCAYMEGDGLGLGFIQVGLEPGEVKGTQRVTIRHSPTILTIYDRLARKLGKIRFICYVQYLPMDLAADIFGEDVAEEHAMDMWDGMEEPKQRVVRMFEYFDIGWGRKGEPTRCVILGNLNNDPVIHEKSAFSRLTVAYYTHVYFPGMRYPIGRIIMQMPDQEAINRVEARMQRVMDKGGPYDEFDVEQIEAEDMEIVARGESLPFVRKSPGTSTAPAVIRHPGQEVSQTTLAYFQMLDRDFNTASGTTEFDRGNLAAQDRTLGENQLVDQRSQTQAQWSKKQVALFYQRLVNMVNYVASVGDTEPMNLDIFGFNIPINDANQPVSLIGKFLEEPSQVLIDDADLTVQDTWANQARRMSQLQALMPFLNMTISPQWLTEQMLRAIGEQDPTEAMGQSAGTAPPAEPAPGAAVAPPATQPQVA